MTSVCGTVYTLAPEVVEMELYNRSSGYTEKSDIFSIGCIAFILLSGNFPFLQKQSDLKDDAKLFRLTQANYTLGDTWTTRNVSEVAKDFIRGTIQKLSEKRWSALEALHFVEKTWIPSLEAKLEAEQKEFNSPTNGPSPSIESRRVKKKRVKMHSTAFRGMQLYGHYGLMKKTVLMAMARNMDKSMLTDLQELFISMDRDHTGTITMNELKEACLTYFKGREFATDANIEEIFHAIDTHHSGEVNYTEFLAAVAESQGLITLELLQEAFDRIDSEGKGYISRGDLRTILGKDADEAKINAMIQEANLYTKDGKIYYDEFLNFMFKDPIEGLELINSVST
jgi:calcium-dependent protein kinase